MATETLPLGQTKGASPPSVSQLDRLLAPLRQVLCYASALPSHQLDQVRFLGANGVRTVQRVRSLGAPKAVDEHLTALEAALQTVDDLSGAARAKQVRTGFAALSRIDALLGTPLPHALRKANNRSTVPSVAEQALEPASSPAASPQTRTAPSQQAAPRSPSPRKLRADIDLTLGVLRWPLAALGFTSDALAALATHGVRSTTALVFRPPTDHELLRPVIGAGRPIKQPGRAAMGGRISRICTVLRPDGTREGRAVLQGAGQLAVVWPGGFPTMPNQLFAPCERVILVGQVHDVDSPVLVDADPVLDDGHQAVRLAQYALDGVPDRALRRAIYQVIRALDGLADPVPSDVLTRLQLPPLVRALRDVHGCKRDAPAGLRRLAFDEELLIQLGLYKPRFTKKKPGIAHPLSHSLIATLQRQVGFSTTDAQQAALAAIKRDLRSNTPMRRVLLGGGQELVAILAMLAIAQDNSQILVVSPDKASAEQRYLMAEPLLRKVNISTQYLGGSLTAETLSAVSQGEIQVIVGTHELLTAGLTYRRLGLVIAEEQANYGALLKTLKGMATVQPDVLLLTLEPLPEPVLWAAYGDCDVSYLHAPVPMHNCELVGYEQRQSAIARATGALAQGRQVLVVVPMHQGVDAVDAKQAAQLISGLANGEFAGYRVGLFHGSMSHEERYRCYNDFRRRRFEVLVATTRVELGPPLPGLNTVLVEQADRLPWPRLVGLGRLTASPSQPVQYLLVAGERPDPTGFARLAHLVQATAEHPLQEILLAEQGLQHWISAEPSVFPRLQAVHLAHRADIGGAGRRVAQALLRADPGLRDPKHRSLAQYLALRWPNVFAPPCPIRVAGPAKRKRRRKRKR